MELNDIKNNLIGEIKELINGLENEIEKAEQISVYEASYGIYDKIRQTQILLLEIKKEIEIKELEEREEEEEE